MTDTVIDIPGVGQVAFPSSMSDRDIADAIKTKILPQAKPEKGALEKGAEAVNTGVNWLGTQLTKGATGLLGAPAAVGDLAQRGGEWVASKIDPVDPTNPGAPAGPSFGAAVAKNFGAGMKNHLTMFGTAPTTEGMNKAVFGSLGVPEVNAGDNPALTLTNPFGIQGKVNLGKMADSAVQAVPGAAALGGGMVPSMISGATSEAAGQAAEGSPWEIPARLAGGFLGYKAGQRVATPLPANLTAEEARLVELAKAKGIPLTVGQETGRGRGIESAVARFPTSQGRMAAFADEQNAAINRDAIGQIGQTGDRVDPTTMNRVIKQASADFDAARNASGDVKLGTDFFRDLNKTITNYLDNTPAAGQVPSVTKRAADFVNQPGHTLTGAQYQEFRRTLNEAAQSVSDSGARNALKGMREALDDAMQASLPADQAAAWQEVRKNWSNLKILTKAAAGGTVGSRNEGNLSPSALSMALRQRQGVDRFSSTEGGLNDTARVASYLADTIPNSGTPQTLGMQTMMTGGPIAAGFGMGGVPGALAAGGAMALPNIVARAMTGSGGFGAGTMRRYLANQSQAPNMGLLNAGSAPFALAPGLMTLPPMPRLEDRRQ
jgi:hypothetical protein